MKVFAQDFQVPDYPASTGFKFSGKTVGDIFSEGLKYALVLGGIAMFGSLIYGGFQLLTSGGNPDGIKGGTNKIVFGLVGFLIIFAAYWIIQLVETIFGFSIL